MTWRTQIGERTLAGAEARLIRMCLAYVRDFVADEFEGHIEGWEFGIRLFDEAEAQSRLALLATVGEALLCESPEYPPLNAINEATVAALFVALEDMLETELDPPEGETAPTCIRKAILAAVRQAKIKAEVKHPSDADAEEWCFLIECLSHRILWDDDYNNAGLFLDADPEVAETIRSMMTIDNDYFLAVPPDPRDSEMPAIHQKLDELCRDDSN